MKKAELWLLREGLARQLTEILSETKAFIGRHEKRMERLEMKMIRLEDKVYEKNKAQKKKSTKGKRS